jgi:hypothetical protein
MNYQDNGKIITFNIVSGIWDWFTEIERIENKLKISSSRAGTGFKFIQEYNLSEIKIDTYCK